MLTSELRSCHRPTSLVRAMDLILRLGPYVTDEARLDRAVPSLADLLADERPAVRAGAVRSLTALLETVQVVSPTNMALVTDFVLPHVRHLGHDDEVEVRVAYASCLAGLTETGERFLDLSESFRSLGGRDDGIGAGDVEEVRLPLLSKSLLFGI
jgi:phosphoinositide-3-kinase regulatory subunit 4